VVTEPGVAVKPGSAVAVGQGVDWGVVSLLEQAGPPSVTRRRHATPAIRGRLILCPLFSPADSALIIAPTPLASSLECLSHPQPEVVPR